MTKKVPKRAEDKRGGVINPQNYNFNQFLNTENFDALQTLRINRSRPQNLATCALGDSQISNDNPGNVPNKGRNFNTQKFGIMYLFIICMISRHWFQTKLLLYIV